MQYPGIIKVTVIRETTATATAPAQLVPVRAAVAEHANGRQDAAAEDSPDGEEESSSDED
jgi:hypothetical protein